MTMAERQSNADPAIHNPDCCKIYVGGLPGQATDDSLREHFSTFGDVHACIEVTDRNSMGSRSGFLKFKDPSSVRRILSYSPHIIHDRQVYPTLADPQKGRTRLQYTRSFTTQRSEVGANKVFVGGISCLTTEAELCAYFERFGALEHVAIIWNADKRSHKGFGFVDFEDEAVVDKVVGIHEIDCKIVECHRYRWMRGEEGDAEACTAMRTIYVSGISPSADEKILGTYFERFGTVKKVYLILNQETGGHHGFAFVTFCDPADARKVLKTPEHKFFKDSTVMRCSLRVEQSTLNAQATAVSGTLPPGDTTASTATYVLPGGTGVQPSAPTDDSQWPSRPADDLPQSHGASLANVVNERCNPAANLSYTFAPTATMRNPAYSPAAMPPSGGSSTAIMVNGSYTVGAMPLSQVEPTGDMGNVCYNGGEDVGYIGGANVGCNGDENVGYNGGANVGYNGAAILSPESAQTANIVHGSYNAVTMKQLHQPSTANARNESNTVGLMLTSHDATTDNIVNGGSNIAVTPQSHDAPAENIVTEDSNIAVTLQSHDAPTGDIVNGGSNIAVTPQFLDAPTYKTHDMVIEEQFEIDEEDETVESKRKVKGRHGDGTADLGTLTHHVEENIVNEGSNMAVTPHPHDAPTGDIPTGGSNIAVTPQSHDAPTYKTQNMVIEEQFEIDEEDETVESKRKVKGRHDDGTADLGTLTHHVEEVEVEMSLQNIGGAMKLVTDKRTRESTERIVMKDKAVGKGRKRVKELEKADVDLIMHEMEIPRMLAEKNLGNTREMLWMP